MRMIAKSNSGVCGFLKIYTYIHRERDWDAVLIYWNLLNWNCICLWVEHKEMNGDMPECSALG